MTNITLGLRVFLLSVLLGACGDRTSIQTGEVGKVLGTNGLEKEIRRPGSFRLESCTVTACSKVVRLQVNKSTSDLKIESLFLPKSNVDIRNVQVGLQFEVKPDEASIDKVFEEVRPIVPGQDGKETSLSGETGRVLLITDDMVYETFLKRKAPDAIVQTLRGHTVDQVLEFLPEIATEAKDNINKMLEDTPIVVTELGFPNGIGEIPEQVINAKRRLFAVEEERARRIKSLEADLVVETQRQAVQRLRVENDSANAKLAGVDYSMYVWLKTQERFADAAGEGTPVAIGASLMPAAVAPVKKKEE